MSIFRLTDVDDNSRSSKEYWDKRCEQNWDKRFHGHYLDDPQVIQEMDDVNLLMIKRLANDIKRKLDARLEDRPMRVLECACGTGRYAPIVAQWFDRYTGIDFADKNIMEAKKRFENEDEGICFDQSDMLNYKSMFKYDLIFMVAAMSSIEQNSKEIVDHLFSMLQPGGCLAIFEQNHYLVKWR